MAKVELSGLLAKSLRAPTSIIISDADNLLELFSEIDTKIEGFAERIMTANDTISPFIAVSINGTLQSRENILKTRIVKSDAVFITSLFAGG